MILSRREIKKGYPIMPSKSFDVPVEPSVLVWARTSAGRTIGDVASRLGVGEDLVKSWELGKRDPTISRLRTLAEYYQRPLDAFLLSEPPKELPLPNDFRKLPNEKTLPLHSDTIFALRKARRLQSVAIELKGEFHDNSIYKLGEITISNDPEELAIKVRGHIGIDFQTQFSWEKDSDALKQWIKSIEALDILVIQMSMPIKDARAFSLIDGGCPVIVLNTGETVNARIFSLFHELGHVLLKKEGICNPSHYPEHAKQSKNVETFCNRFAGAFLVPKSNLLENGLVKANNNHEWSDKTLGAISKEYRVSREVILRRLLIFNITSEIFYNKWRDKDEQRQQKLKEQKKGSGGGRNIARECIQQNSASIVSLIIESYHDNKLSKYDIADYLEVNLKHLPDIERTLEV
jgi:Zn-dependent peptidase ImmA (M78 family)/transcriptional regulator with XRE-family HTH domain